MRQDLKNKNARNKRIIASIIALILALVFVGSMIMPFLVNFV